MNKKNIIGQNLTKNVKKAAQSEKKKVYIKD